MERKEAIEVVRKNYPHVSESNTQFETALRTLVPELIESADERIRKAIIEHLRQDIELEQILSEEVGSDWIAWLEKQGEQNLANSAKTCKNDEEIWSEEDERLCRCLIKDQKKALDEVRNDKYGHSEIISDLKEMYNERIAWLKSLKGRVQPQQKQDEQIIARGERKNLALSLMDYLDDNRVEGCMDLSSMECEDLETAVMNSDWGKVYRYMKKKLKK